MWALDVGVCSHASGNDRGGPTDDARTMIIRKHRQTTRLWFNLLELEAFNCRSQASPKALKVLWITHLMPISYFYLTPAGACNPNPCGNGGTCILDPAGGHICSCANNFGGMSCQIDTSGGH